MPRTKSFSLFALIGVYYHWITVVEFVYVTAGIYFIALVVTMLYAFNVKKPNLKGSLKQAFGDNIYHHNLQTGEWMQEPSHHSLPNGNQNLLNVDHDTQTEFILVGERFTYWGGNGPSIPNHFRNYNGIDICALRNHKCNFSVAFVNEFLAWFNSLNVSGYLYPPKQFRKKP